MCAYNRLEMSEHKQDPGTCTWCGIFCLGAGVTVAQGDMALGALIDSMQDKTWNLAGAGLLQAK